MLGIIIIQRILIMKENGLINYRLEQQLPNMAIENSLMANNHLPNMINCMKDVFQTEKQFQLSKTQFLKLTLNGLRILFYIILDGFTLSIAILFSEITVFISEWLNF